ncbi:MAG: alpha/beta hydrolase [Myxococcota bacterium]|nr:alpha/beta hydrolase [Myxococcota bacterium]
MLQAQLDNPDSLLRRVRGFTASKVADGLFGNLPRLGRYIPLTRPELYGVEVERDIPYAEPGGPDWTLDVYRPAGTEGRRLPVMLYVHGGGFHALSKDTHWLMGIAFARAGYLVFNINYRLSHRHPFPAPLEDVCTAYRWVIDHAGTFGGDFNRLVLAGESAGANLVTALTVACCYPRFEPYARKVFECSHVPTAVLATCGILQVNDMERYARAGTAHPLEVDVMKHVSRDYVGVNPDPYATELANPLLLLERAKPPTRPLPPFMAAVGLSDPLLNDTLRLERALYRLGVRCDAPTYAGEPHAFFALIWRAKAQRCWRDMFAFLDDVVPSPEEAQRLRTDRAAQGST